MKKMGFAFVIAVLVFIFAVPVYAVDYEPGTHETVYTPGSDGNFGITHTCTYSDGKVYVYTVSANSKTPDEGVEITVTQSVPMDGETTSFCALLPGDDGYAIDYDNVYNLESSGSFTISGKFAENGVGIWPRTSTNGYCDFLHWNKDGSIKSFVGGFVVDTEGNVTKEEKAPVYIVTFEPNAEDAVWTLPYNKLSCGDDQTITMVDELFVSRKGYQLDSWNTKPDGTGVSYKCGETITLTGDMTLYAIWSEKEEYLYTETKYGEKKDVKGILLEAYSKKNPDITIKKIKFTSSDKKVAKANKKGIVTGGKKTGLVTITMYIKTVSQETKSNGKIKKKVSKWTKARDMSLFNMGKNKNK